MKEKLADFGFAGYSTEKRRQKVFMILIRRQDMSWIHIQQFRLMYADSIVLSGDQTKCVIASTASPYKFVKECDERYRCRECKCR